MAERLDNRHSQYDEHVKCWKMIRDDVQLRPGYWIAVLEETEIEEFVDPFLDSEGNVKSQLIHTFPEDLWAAHESLHAARVALCKIDNLHVTGFETKTGVAVYESERKRLQDIYVGPRTQISNSQQDDESQTQRCNVHLLMELINWGLRPRKKRTKGDKIQFEKYSKLEPFVRGHILHGDFGELSAWYDVLEKPRRKPEKVSQYVQMLYDMKVYMLSNKSKKHTEGARHAYTQAKKECRCPSGAEANVVKELLTRFKRKMMLRSAGKLFADRSTDCR